MVTLPNQQVVTLILYIDGCATDQNGNIKIEPIAFTLGIFNYQTRCQPSAWRHLGYVNNLSVECRKQKIPKKDRSLATAINYHRILDVIFTSLRKLQANETGLRWKLLYKETIYDMLFLFPVIFVIGDTEGHDKQCGHFLNRSKVKTLCRHCDIPLERSGDPSYQCRLYTRRRLENMVTANDLEGLQAVSHHPVVNAFYKLMIGDPRYNIHGAATPAELLHMIQLGWMKYGVEGLYAVLTGTASHQYKSHVQFVLDQICGQYGALLPHQSERNLPRTKFGCLISAGKKLNAHEYQGVLLILLLSLCCDKGHWNLHFYSNVPEVMIRDFIWILQLLMQWEEFMKLPEIPKADAHKFEKAIRNFMYLYTTIIDRQKGMKTNIIKVHIILHMMLYIIQNGAPRNWDSGPGESNHKYNIKAPFLTTQKRHDSVSYQVAKRFADNLVIERTVRGLFPAPPLAPVPMHDPEPKLAGAWYQIEANGDTTNFSYHSKEAAANATRAEDRVIRFLHQYLLHALPEDHSAVECWTEYTRFDRDDSTKKYLFRTCPNYRKDRDWFDWALVDWGGDENKIPTHLLAFLDLTNLPVDFHLDISGYAINGPGIYAVVERFITTATEVWTWPSSTIDMDFVTDMLLHGTLITGVDGLSQLFLIDLDSIVDVCAVVPNLQPNLNQKIVGQPQLKRTKNYQPLGGWFMLRPRSIWGLDFLDFIREEYHTRPRWLPEETEEEEKEEAPPQKKPKARGT